VKDKMERISCSLSSQTSPTLRGKRERMTKFSILIGILIEICFKINTVYGIWFISTDKSEVGAE